MKQQPVPRGARPRRGRAALARGDRRRAALGAEAVPLADALGRVLAEDVRAGVDVPGFDRSNMDGFAVRAADTFGATEEAPVRLRARTPRRSRPASRPRGEVAPGTATAIATGGMLPRGADAVVPVEHTDVEDGGASWSCAARVTPGAARLVRRHRHRRAARPCSSRGTRLTSRETGVLAAIGARARRGRAPAARRDPLDRRRDHRSPASRCGPGLVYDTNGRILADAVRELGGEPGSSARSATTRRALRARARARPRERRPRAALGRHLEGRGRPVASRRRASSSRASSSTASR